jgi:hypothetical protein
MPCIVAGLGGWNAFLSRRTCARKGGGFMDETVGAVLEQRKTVCGGESYKIGSGIKKGFDRCLLQCLELTGNKQNGSLSHPRLCIPSDGHYKEGRDLGDLHCLIAVSVLHGQPAHDSSSWAIIAHGRMLHVYLASCGNKGCTTTRESALTDIIMVSLQWGKIR